MSSLKDFFEEANSEYKTADGGNIRTVPVLPGIVLVRKLPGDIKKEVSKGYRRIWQFIVKNWPYGIYLVIGFILVWEFLPRTGIISPILVPPFSVIISRLWEMNTSGEIIPHVEASLMRAGLGFLFGSVSGLLLGLLMGWYRQFEKYTDLFLQCLRNTSTMALMPLFILFLGIGEESKLAIITYGTFWPILINTISGVKNVDPLFVKAARSMRVSEFELFRYVILPGSVPSILSGLRLGVKNSLLLVTGAEMIAASTGLGFYIQNARFIFDTKSMYAGILIMVFFGIVANYSMVWIEKKFTYWKIDNDEAVL